jgi:hypothetical protein
MLAGLYSRRNPLDDKAGHQRGRSGLENLFCSYHAADVCVALGVSELWLPNIGSQVKHFFAYNVFASMNAGLFRAERRLDTYEQFAAFTTEFHSLLPSYPTLEDYVPETDWGEVRTASQGIFPRLFYGTSLERVPDFVTAFEMQNAQNANALVDMHSALSLQDRVIVGIDKALVGASEHYRAGHIETPAQQFWDRCRNILATAASVIQPISDALVTRLGGIRATETDLEFGDAVMTGRVMPAVMIEIDGQKYPISLRNALSAVIDHWAGHDQSPEKTGIELYTSIANFITRRQDPRSCFGGPFRLVTTRGRELPHIVTAVISGEALHFVLMVDDKSLPLLPQAERDILELIGTGEEWGLKNRENSVLQIRNTSASLVGRDAVRFIAVLSLAGTGSVTSLPKPKCRAHVLWLPDFVSIFDSLEDIAELERFWEFHDEIREKVLAVAGVVDLFAAFRDSHATIIEGAVTPDLITIDPHWGSSWRYRELAKFWRNAPGSFPDDYGTAWRVETPGDEPQLLSTKGGTTISWSATIGSCSAHFIFEILDQELEYTSGAMLELFIQCLADAAVLRQDLIARASLFRRKRIVTVARANTALFATAAPEHVNEAAVREPLLSGWNFKVNSDNSEARFEVRVNLSRVYSQLMQPRDAAFQAECLTEWFRGASSCLNERIDAAELDALARSGSGKPRFIVGPVQWLMDTPEVAKAVVPKPEHYKTARRYLAIKFKELGVAPGRYELEKAKSIVDAARHAFRSLVHGHIARQGTAALLSFSLEQLDALTIEYRRKSIQLSRSFSHEVNYDRSEEFSKAYKRFVTESQDFRYLLECALSGPRTDSSTVDIRAVLEVVAAIDWLLVLYNASDVLHNGIDVAGIEIDQSFVPYVFYSSNRNDREEEFALETAGSELGIGVSSGDAVTFSLESPSELRRLDEAFLTDTGFSFTHLTATMGMLSRWQTTHGREDFHLSYHALPADIVKTMMKAIDLTREEAERLVTFATLAPESVRRLLGKTFDEDDVPVWEHTKRASRSTIRPLIPFPDGTLAWGAALTERALHIWRSSIGNGYLPADFDWPHIKEVVREIKEGLENGLTARAFEICNRFATYAQSELDFRRRFPRETIPDVGDFDVLAFWPETNHWLVIECKYNQPPFCLKDARRLRDRIFGSSGDRGQFSKIERRREFLKTNADRLRQLLGWPETSGAPFLYTELYVSRMIYWWMRNPPYEVPTQFVRVDVLNGWMQSNGFVAQKIK